MICTNVEVTQIESLNTGAYHKIRNSINGNGLNGSIDDIRASVNGTIRIAPNKQQHIQISNGTVIICTCVYVSSSQQCPV